MMEKQNKNEYEEQANLVLTKKLSSIKDENELVKKIIAELKKNNFTYENFEEVIAKVKSFYKNNATI